MIAILQTARSACKRLTFERHEKHGADGDGELQSCYTAIANLETRHRPRGSTAGCDFRSVIASAQTRPAIRGDEGARMLTGCLGRE